MGYYSGHTLKYKVSYLRHSNKTLLFFGWLQRPSAALASIDDAHIACFGRLAAGRFAQRPPRSNAAEARADATVLLECLRLNRAENTV